MSATTTKEKDPDIKIVSPTELPPATSDGKPDVKNEAAAKVAVDKTINAEVTPSGEFDFGGIHFKVSQLKLRRERKFINLFPVLQRPFDRIREIQEKRGEDTQISIGQFLVEALSKEGDEVLDVVTEICAEALDNAKPNSVSQHIDAEWVSTNLSLVELADVVSAQIVEQSWGNFFQRVAMLTGTAAPEA